MSAIFLVNRYERQINGFLVVVGEDTSEPKALRVLILAPATRVEVRTEHSTVVLRGPGYEETLLLKSPEEVHRFVRHTLDVPVPELRP